MVRMRDRWFRLLPLFLAAFWLPFQAVAAMARPFCRHGEAHMLVVAEVAAAEHCAMPGAPAAEPHGVGCDDCGFCHLAAAGFIPAPERGVAVIVADRDFGVEVPFAPASNIPEPPQQPPKRLA